MTRSDREVQYIKETGDKRPERRKYAYAGNYASDLELWFIGFSTWLSARLEKAEEEKDSMGKLQLEIGDWQDGIFTEATAAQTNL